MKTLRRLKTISAVVLSLAIITSATSAGVADAGSLDGSVEKGIVAGSIGVAIALYGYGQATEKAVEKAAVTTDKHAYDRIVAVIRESFVEKYRTGWVFGESAAWAIVGNEIASYIKTHPSSQPRMCQFMSDVGLQFNGPQVAQVGCGGPSQSGTVLNENADAQGGGSTSAESATKDGLPNLGDRKVSPEAKQHILHGDPDNPKSGGHLYGTGRPDKSEFPMGWDEDKVIEVVEDIANNPDIATESSYGGKHTKEGEVDGVDVLVVIGKDGSIITAYPVGVPGNPR